jgi:hypothetical protein
MLRMVCRNFDFLTVSYTDAIYLGEYSRSKGMLVHVWETCRSGEGFLTFRHNCSSVFSEVSKGDHSAGCCGIDLGRMGHRTGGGGTPPYSTSTPQYMSTQTLYGYPYPPAQGYAVPVSYVSYAPSSQAPVYSTNSYEMPVNIRNGAVLTESRGIFIQNLNFGCSLSDLHSLLRTVGQPVHYTLNCDPRTGESKGHATATFASQEQAQRAAHSLNRVEHMGRMLTVRMDKETTAVGKIGSPLIVSSNMLYAVR